MCIRDSHYMARHFYADILGSLKMEGTCFTPYIQNETFTDTTSTVEIYVKDMDCNCLHRFECNIETKALEVAYIEGFDVSPYVSGKEDEILIEARFNHSDGTSSTQVEVLKPYKHMKLRKVSINYSTKRVTDTLHITLKADAVALFTEVTVHGVNVILSDNFFHLTDTNEHVITGTLPSDYVGIPEVTVKSLCDSYSF